MILFLVSLNNNFFDKIDFFENLYITDINILNPWVENKSAKIILQVRRKNGKNRDFIYYKN